MRRFRIMTLAIAAVLALGTAFAATASAKKANLVLREGGEHLYEGLDPALSVGDPVEASFETALGGCATQSPILGEVRENGLPTDIIHGVEGHEGEETTCTDEYEGKVDHFGLEVLELSLSSKGKVKLAAFMHIEIYGMFGSGTACEYHFTLRKAKAAFQVPALGKAGDAVVTGVAKSEGKHANKACPKKEDPTFTLTLADNGGFPLETTLEG